MDFTFEGKHFTPTANLALDATPSKENIILALEAAAAHALFTTIEGRFASEADALAEVQRTGLIRQQVTHQGSFFFQVARRDTADPAQYVPFIQVDRFPGLLHGGDVVVTATDVGRFVAAHAFAHPDQEVAKDLAALPPVPTLQEGLPLSALLRIFQGLPLVPLSMLCCLP